MLMWASVLGEFTMHSTMTHHTCTTDCYWHCSPSMSASIPFGRSTQAGINFTFKSTLDCGTFLVLSPPAVSRQILSKQHIVNYMRWNFNRWLEFANATMGLGLHDEEIIFVSGTMKTNQWAVTAFRGECQTIEGSFTTNLGSLVEASILISVLNETLPTRYYRAGPSRRTYSTTILSNNLPNGEGSSPPSLPPEQCDQCIFMNYYRMKRRFWKPLLMQAASTPFQDHGWGPEDGSDPGSPLDVVDETDMSTEECGQANQV